MLAALAVAAATYAQISQAPPSTSSGQAPQLPVATVCGQQARPAAQPPEGSGPVVLYVAPCFEAQGGQ
jgi:hypothetical protein